MLALFAMNRLLRLFLISCFGLLPIGVLLGNDRGVSPLSQKPDTNKQIKLKKEYGATLERLALLFSSKLSSQISPQSGREFRGEVLYDQGLGESREDGFVACRVKLLWQARDWWRGVPYDWCEVSGIVRYYPPKRSIDVPTGLFTAERVNKHVEAVSDSITIRKILDKDIKIVLDEIR